MVLIPQLRVGQGLHVHVRGMCDAVKSEQVLVAVAHWLRLHRCQLFQLVRGQELQR